VKSNATINRKKRTKEEGTRDSHQHGQHMVDSMAVVVDMAVVAIPPPGHSISHCDVSISKRFGRDFCDLKACVFSHKRGHFNHSHPHRIA